MGQVCDEAVQACEDALRAELMNNGELELLADENAIIRRMLSRRTELAVAYGEIHRLLGGRHFGVQRLLQVMLSTAALWNPDQIAAAWSARDRLLQVNTLIAARAAELAKLLQERARLHEESGFSGDTHAHICKVIEAAAVDNHLFNSFVRKPLASLRGEYLMKYWPRLHEVVAALGRDAAAADLEPTDPVTAAATRGRRRSRADFFNALFEAIAESSDDRFAIPVGFRLTDGSVASLANCLLDLPPDALVDAAYVKRLRQRGRARSPA